MQVASTDSPKRNQGVFAQWWGWMNGINTSNRQPEGNHHQDPRRSSHDTPENEDLVQQSWVQQTVFASPDEEFRHDCMAFAKVRNLSAVEEMRAFYVDEHSIESSSESEAVVIGIGAHYKRDNATQEDVLLHVLKEMERVGPSRPYILVYFNANTAVPLIPDTSMIQQIHAALDPAHKRNLKAFYVVHPTRSLKNWIFMLRLAIPEIYGRATYLERLTELEPALGEHHIDIPQHVRDYDASLKK